MVKYILIMVGLVAWLQSAFAQNRDPFSPYMFEAPVAEVEEEVHDGGSTVRPLNEEPLKSYRLIGVMVSPEKSVAVIHSPDRREYFVKTGDALGNEGGIIDAMSVEGISVNQKDEIVNMKVTNKFEIQNGN